MNSRNYLAILVNSIINKLISNDGTELKIMNYIIFNNFFSNDNIQYLKDVDLFNLYNTLDIVPSKVQALQNYKFPKKENTQNLTEERFLILIKVFEELKDKLQY